MVGSPIKVRSDLATAGTTEPSTPEKGKPPGSPQVETPVTKAVKAYQKVVADSTSHLVPSPNTKSKFTDAERRIEALPKDTPRRRSHDKARRLARAAGHVFSKGASGVSKHRNAKGRIADFFSTRLEEAHKIANSLALSPQKKKEIQRDATFYDSKHVHESDVNRSGKRVGGHWVDPAKNSMIVRGTEVINPDNGVAYAKFRMPGDRSAKSSCFFPSQVFGVNPINTEDELSKMIDDRSLPVAEVKSERRTLYEVDCNGKTISIVGFRQRSGPSFNPHFATYYPLFLCRELPANLNDDVTIVKQGCFKGVPSYELVRTGHDIVNYVKISIDKYIHRSPRSDMKNPVLFMDADHAWVDIAPYYKTKYQAGPSAFPLSAGVVFKVKISDQDSVTQAYLANMRPDFS